MISKFNNKLSSIIQRLDIHTLEVVKKSSSSMIVKVGGMVAGLLLSIFLGRLLGAEGLGVINLTNRIANILLVITLFGMQNVLIKEIAIAHNRKNWQHIGNCISTAHKFNGGLSLVIAIFFISITPWLSKTIFKDFTLKLPLIIASIAIIPMTFSRIFRSGLNGYRKIWQSNLVDQALSTWFVGIILIIATLIKWPITIINVALMYAIGRIVVLLTTGLYWKKLFKKQSNKFILSELLPSALPLLMANASTVLLSNVDAVMLGWLSNTKDVGLYTVAARLALLTSFFLQVSNASISPKIAALYAEGRKKELAKMVKKVTKGLLFLGGITWIVFIFFGKNMLGIWGKEFQGAFWILIILGAGQFINLSTGAVGALLMMTGNEKIQGRISLIFLFLNLILNYILIAHLGALGAAVATALTVAGANISKAIYVKKTIGIRTFF